MPPLSSSGILGSFPQPNDATDESTTASPRAVGGILAPLDRWNPQSSSAGRRILAPLERLNIAGDQTTPAWRQSPAPFAANDGSLSKSIAQPWGNPWPQAPPAAWGHPPTALSFYPPLQQPTASYAAPLQRNGTGVPAVGASRFRQIRRGRADTARRQFGTTCSCFRPRAGLAGAELGLDAKGCDRQQRAIFSATAEPRLGKAYAGPARRRCAGLRARMTIRTRTS
jgi:hypothetical protein